MALVFPLICGIVFFQIKLLIANVGWEGHTKSVIQVNIVVLLQIKKFIHLTICFHNRGHACKHTGDYSFSLSWLVMSLSWLHLGPFNEVTCHLVLSIFSFLFLDHLIFPFGTEMKSFTLRLQYCQLKLVSYFIWGIWRGVSVLGLQITFFDIKKLMFPELEKEANETSKSIVDARFILVL